MFSSFSFLANRRRPTCGGSIYIMQTDEAPEGNCYAAFRGFRLSVSKSLFATLSQNFEL